MAQRPRLTLLAAILSSALVTIDATVVNVALPAVEQDLGGGLPAQQWVSNAYLLALGSLILIGGSLVDIYGARRVFAVGVVAFGILSLACALAPTIEVLVAARAVQRVGSSARSGSSMAVCRRGEGCSGGQLAGARGRAVPARVLQTEPVGQVIQR